MKHGDLLAEVRKIPEIDAIWKASDLKGRPSCAKKDNPSSPCLGTNIMIGVGDELVTLFEKEGKIFCRDFRQTTKTKLGEEVRAKISAKFGPDIFG